jgi:hypothetical protein
MADYRNGLHLIPEHMHDSVTQWIEEGFPHPRMMGTFFKAILSNQFVETISQADEANYHSLKGWATFLYNYMPSPAYGSYENLLKWYSFHHPESEQVNEG